MGHSRTDGLGLLRLPRADRAAAAFFHGRRRRIYVGCRGGSINLMENELATVPLRWQGRNLLVGLFVPETGPALLVCSHSGWLDPGLLLSCFAIDIRPSIDPNSSIAEVLGDEDMGRLVLLVRDPTRPCAEYLRDTIAQRSTVTLMIDREGVVAAARRHPCRKPGGRLRDRHGRRGHSLRSRIPNRPDQTPLCRRGGSESHGPRIRPDVAAD